MIDFGFFDIDPVGSNVFCPSLEAKVIMLSNYSVIAETEADVWNFPDDL